MEKYASNNTQAIHLRYVIRSSYVSAGQRIRFANFGNSEYRSREMGEALRMLERALLIHLIYPVTDTRSPLNPDIKRLPRLQVLDTGMLNHFVGIQKEIIGKDDLNEVYIGIMIEHLVGQELLTLQHGMLDSLHFWVREHKDSSYNGKDTT